MYMYLTIHESTIIMIRINLVQYFLAVPVHDLQLYQAMFIICHYYCQLTISTCSTLLIAEYVIIHI